MVQRASPFAAWRLAARRLGRGTSDELREGDNLALGITCGFEQLRPRGEDLKHLVRAGCARKRDTRLRTFTDQRSQAFAICRNLLHMLPNLRGGLIEDGKLLTQLVACLNQDENLKEMRAEKEVIFPG